MKYYANIEDAPLSDLLIQAIINPDNQFMVFSDYKWQDCPDTGTSMGAFIVFFQGGTIDCCTHVTGPVDQ